MTAQDINQTVIAVIKASTETELELTPQTHLIRDMGLSSVETMLLLSDLEDRFHIRFPVSRLRTVQTVNDLTQAVIDLLQNP